MPGEHGPPVGQASTHGSPTRRRSSIGSRFGRSGNRSNTKQAIIGQLPQTQMRHANLARLFTAETRVASPEKRDRVDDWYTPVMRLKAKRRKLAQKFMRETLLYAAFMGLFCYVSSTLRSTDGFFVNTALSVNLITGGPASVPFNSIAATEDIFAWMQTGLLPVLFPLVDPATGLPLDEYGQEFALTHNFMIGRIRWRQVRVLPTTCTGASQFQSQTPLCHLPFTPKTASTLDSFLPNVSQSSDPAALLAVAGAFKYRTEEELCNGTRLCTASTVVGRYRYPVAGYAWDFNQNVSVALQELASLKAAPWIDKSTRAIIIDFSVFNPNSRILCAVELLLEFLPTGIVTTAASLKPMPMLELLTNKDRILFAGELVLLLVVGLYALREFYEFYTYWRQGAKRCPRCLLKKQDKEGIKDLIPCIECGHQYDHDALPNCTRCTRETPVKHVCWRGYFQDPWNWVDMLNYIFFVVMFGLRFNVRASIPSLVLDVGDRFVLVQPYVWRFAAANWVGSVNALLCFFKSFRYLGKVRSLSSLIRTFEIASFEIVTFLVVFAVIFFGYGLAYHLAFGQDLQAYADWPAALTTLFRALMWDVNYTELRMANSVLAPLFFITYTIIALFILSNIFIAIISASFYASQEEKEGGTREDFMAASLHFYLATWRARLAKFGFADRNAPWTRTLALVNHLIASPILSASERDDLMVFRNEVEYNPYNIPLFTHVLRAFHGRVDKVMTKDDYLLLRNSVLEFRKKEDEPQNKQHWWEQDIEMQPEVPPDVQILHVVTDGAATDAASSASGEAGAGRRARPHPLSREFTSNTDFLGTTPRGGTGTPRSGSLPGSARSSARGSPRAVAHSPVHAKRIERQLVGLEESIDTMSVHLHRLLGAVEEKRQREFPF